MTVIVEDGTGILAANAYTSQAFVRRYLARRNRATAWDGASEAVQEAAIIAATDYIDRRWGPRFLGRKEHVDLERAADAFLSLGANPSDGDTVVIDTTTYTFRAALASAFDVLIGATATDTRDNLVAAINLAAGAGSTYGTGTTVHPTVSAEASGTIDLLATAKTAGDNGNTIVTTSSNASVAWETSTLTGGEDEIEQPLEWPRVNVVSRAGRFVNGIPEQLKEATAEYAERAIAATLLPDPTVDATGRAVVESEQQVGPIRTRTRYEEGATLSQLLRPYPAADRLLSEYVHPGGRVVRA